MEKLRNPELAVSLKVMRYIFGKKYLGGHYKAYPELRTHKLGSVEAWALERKASSDGILLRLYEVDKSPEFNWSLEDEKEKDEPVSTQVESLDDFLKGTHQTSELKEKYGLKVEQMERMCIEQKAREGCSGFEVARAVNNAGLTAFFRKYFGYSHPDSLTVLQLSARDINRIERGNGNYASSTPK
ncbi:hypothetical protein JXB11_03525 [Candidatus Woesearchaeota archaeon]|nr:hypothetical protein [Candidatus Woesearchaeota archaeon]